MKDKKTTKTNRTVEQEAEAMAIRSYISTGWFGGKSKASGGMIVSKKFFDFEAAKNQAIKYLQSIGFRKK